MQKIYKCVSEELKREIEESFSTEEACQFSTVLDDIVDEFTAEEGDHYTPSDNMISEAEERQSSGLLTIDSIVSVLRRGEIARFTAMFSVYCGLPIDVVKGMIIQESAQGLAIACRATGILKADFINMYLLTSRLRGENIIDHSRLDLALKYFDKIKEPVARHILNQSRNS